MNWIKSLYNFLGKGTPTLHALGDSHAQVFEYMKNNANLYAFDCQISCCIVQGASNMGLANPHSKTQAMPIFYQYLKNVRRKDFIVLMLGEVDCGFVIWYRAQKHGMSVESQFQMSLNNYTKFIEELRRLGFHRIMVCNTPFPTISDSELIPKGEVANKRFEVKATLKERTALTRRYNKKLKEVCLQNQIEFIDCEQEIINADTNSIDSKFLNDNPFDHHLSNRPFADVLFPKIDAVLKNHK